MTSRSRTHMNHKPVFWRQARTVLNMHSKFQDKLLCDGPVFSAGDACAYSCTYCYVPAMNRKLLQQPGMPTHGIPHEDMLVRREHALALLQGQIMGLSAAIRSTPKVLYMSHSVDIAPNLELAKETIEACNIILSQTQWKIRLLSKSTFLPYIAGMLDIGENRHRLKFGISLGTVDDALAKAIEPDCPLPSKRVKSFHELQDAGFETFAMICPSLPVQDYHAWADHIHTTLRTTRCEHVWAEVINVRGESMRRTSNALLAHGFDWEAEQLKRFDTDREAWETYARSTFLAHAKRMHGFNFDHPDHFDGIDPHPRLRFLQYVTKASRAWWHNETSNGALLLGAAA